MTTSQIGQDPFPTGVSAWLASPPLTMAGLRGRVVLIDFWAPLQHLAAHRALPPSVADYPFEDLPNTARALIYLALIKLMLRHLARA